MDDAAAMAKAKARFGVPPRALRAKSSPKAKAAAVAPTRAVVADTSSTNPIAQALVAVTTSIFSVAFGWAPQAHAGLTPDQLVRRPLDAFSAVFAIGRAWTTKAGTGGTRNRLVNGAAFAPTGWGPCARNMRRALIVASSVVLLWSVDQAIAAAQTGNWPPPAERQMFVDGIMHCPQTRPMRAFMSRRRIQASRLCCA
eukprot:6478585-Amphidinium_carterae.1